MKEKFCIAQENFSIEFSYEHRKRLIYEDEKQYATNNGIYKIMMVVNSDSEISITNYDLLYEIMHNIDNMDLHNFINVSVVQDIFEEIHCLYPSNDKDYAAIVKYFSVIKLKY